MTAGADDPVSAAPHVEDGGDECRRLLYMRLAELSTADPAAWRAMSMVVAATEGAHRFPTARRCLAELVTAGTVEHRRDDDKQDWFRLRLQNNQPPPVEHPDWNQYNAPLDPTEAKEYAAICAKWQRTAETAMRQSFAWPVTHRRGREHAWVIQERQEGRQLPIAPIPPEHRGRLRTAAYGDLCERGKGRGPLAIDLAAVKLWRSESAHAEPARAEQP